ncbi:MAG: hypothetical protein IPK63_15920 [Candidatus Competibacteraceae bacterium]|jgi:hypothetical protein|nr:hypothetical protein [Candidatus Competibacteraceae bacterium]
MTRKIKINTDEINEQMAAAASVVKYFGVSVDYAAQAFSVFGPIAAQVWQSVLEELDAPIEGRT